LLSVTYNGFCGAVPSITFSYMAHDAGHSSLQVTMDRYGHLFRSDDHGRVMDAISTSFLSAPWLG
jgi:hypothetical protein